MRERPMKFGTLGTLSAIASVGVGILDPALHLLLAPTGLVEQGLTWVADLGWWGVLAFVGIYVIATIAFLPGSVLTLGAGVLFGPLWGSVLVFCSATAGAIAAFWMGRHFVRGWVEGKLVAGNANFAALDRAVAQDGFKIVLLTRLSPLFPFNALNYLYGLTGVRLRDYAIASVGMLPGTVMYVYLGASFKSLAAVVAGGDRTKTPQEWALFILGLGATVAVTVVITRIARQALNASLQTPIDATEERGHGNG
jgi:uncharacterized membrane protein YdjX (TVP38/TMEM64 family)